MKKLRKIEWQELKNLGMFEQTLNAYSNSDDEVFAEAEAGLYTIRDRDGGLVSTENTVKDLNDYFLSFVEEE